MRAALYARYSTPLQSRESIADQLRVCERLVNSLGFAVVSTFSDAEISGGTTRRPGYRAMLAAARNGDFDVIIAEDLKRLWRDQAEQWRCIKEMLDRDIFFITYSGLDSRDPNFDLYAAVMGAAAELDLREASYRSRRALEGRMRAGRPAVNLAYGYISAPRSLTGEVEVHPVEAEVVRWVFGAYATGWSPERIARELNAADVPAPSSKRAKGRDSQWWPGAIHRSAEGGGGMLLRDMYRGVSVWGRRKVVRFAADSTRIRYVALQPPSEWIVVPMERLRVVSDELWERVQRRLAEVQSTRGSWVRNGVAARKAAHASYRPGISFREIATCQACGSPLVPHNTYAYICSASEHGGCASNTVLARKAVNAQLLRAASNHVESRDAQSRIELHDHEKRSCKRGDYWTHVLHLEAEVKNLRSMIDHDQLRRSPSLADRLMTATDALALFQMASRPISASRTMKATWARKKAERAASGLSPDERSA